MQNSGGRVLASGVKVEHVSSTELYNVMAAASSQDPSQMRASSDRFKEMQGMFGTFNALHEIAAQRSFPLSIRQQSIIQFKNVALSHWRSRKVLSDEHRVNIRSRCLTFLDEDDETITVCNEVIVARIARQDYPGNWGNLIPDLLTSIDLNLEQRCRAMVDDARSTLVLKRSLKLLYSILKEFSTVKMPNGVKNMAKIVEDIHIILTRYYSTMVAGISPHTVNPQTISSPKVYHDVLLAHLVYKSITRMAIWALQRIDKVGQEEKERNHAWVNSIFQSSVIQVKVIAELRSKAILSLGPPGTRFNVQTSRSLSILTRHLRVFGKFFRRLQQLSHSHFVTLPMSTELILFYWSQVVEAANGPIGLVTDSDEAVYPVRYLVQGMVLFKESLSQWTPVRKDGTEREQSLPLEFVEDAVRFLVSRFIPLKPEDLERWMADPEEWVNIEDRESDLWEFELRPCSERVLLQLCNQYPQFVTPLLESTFKQLALQLATDLPDILQKEALYCAIGRCPAKLKGVIPFEQWLENTLIVEAQASDVNYPIIKRRIAWVLGKWVSEQCTSPNNPKIWEVLVHLLKDRGAGTDTVVRLTAAMALKDSVDTIEFDPTYFEPYLPTTLSELILLMREADSFEIKRRIDNSLNIIIERTKEMISPFVDIITQTLPTLWTEAGEQWLFKSSLLITVTKLVEAVRTQSVCLGGIVVPLVRESLSPGVITNLDEDGLCLWLAALRNTVTIMSVNNAPALFELLPQALELLSTNFDLLGKITNIIESYLWVDATMVLQACAPQLLSAFMTAWKSDVVVTLNTSDMLHVLSLMVQIAPSGLWGEAMHTSGVFAHIVVTLVDGEVQTTLLVDHILLLSRIVMADKRMFSQLISATAAVKNFKEEYLYNGILDQWYAKFDNMSEPRYRKLAAMGIAALVSTGRQEVLERLPVEIFNLWIDVFCEIKEARLSNENTDVDAPPPSPTSLRRHWELDEAPNDYYQDTEGTPEYDRRKAVYDRDPVRTTHLGAFVGKSLREAEALCGPDVFQTQYLSKVEPGVLEQIHAGVTGT